MQKEVKNLIEKVKECAKEVYRELESEGVHAIFFIIFGKSSFV